MAYARSIRYEPGETLFACSICGFTYRFPSELVYADDRQFYCTRTCWRGETVTGHNLRRSAWVPPRDNDQPAVFGSRPSWYASNSGETDVPPYLVHTTTDLVLDTYPNVYFYTVVADSNGGAINVTLPASPTYAIIVNVRRRGANVVTALGTVNGSTNYSLTSDYADISLQWDSAANGWVIL